MTQSMGQAGVRQSGKNLPDINQRGMKQRGRRQLARSQPGMLQQDLRQLVRNEAGLSQPRPSQPGQSQSGPRKSSLKQKTRPNQHEATSTSQSSKSQTGLSHPSQEICEQEPESPRPSQQEDQLVASQPGLSQPGGSQASVSQLGMRQTSMDYLQIRTAKAEDCSEILRLIEELAACENVLGATKLTADDLLRDGFGDTPLFYCLIAEANSQQNPSDKLTVGFAMYYFTYDSRIGKVLYLEDFYVTKAYQGLRIGAEMLKILSQIAIRTQCSCMHLRVVIWNQSSIAYYTSRGALDLSSEEGWRLFKFNREELLKIIEEE
nr:spermidine/spermine N(1)-acetyltransferase-like protein 1 [Aotus nancymaae]